MSLYNLLGHIESRGLLDTTVKEVVGINVPKIALVRNWDERLDTATSEIGNTAGFVGVGWILDKALQKLFKKAQAGGGNTAKWAIFGRSFAIFSAIFSIMWAMPFIRNYMTTKRTGTTGFTEMIGAKANQNKNQHEVEAAMVDYRRKAITILGLGLAGVAASVGGALLAINNKAGLGVLPKIFTRTWGRSLLQWAQKDLLLKDGSFKHFKGLPALLFWGVPAYGGWIHASRDKFEYKEQLLKFAVFVACFFGPPKLLKRWFDKKSSQLFPKGVDTTYQGLTQAIKQATDGQVKGNLKKLLGYWKVKSLAGLLSSILLLGTVPQLLNIFLTNKRMSKKQAQLALQGQSQGLRFQEPDASKLPTGSVQRKPFAKWGRTN